jgi:hypothetical protein
MDVKTRFLKTAETKETLLTHYMQKWHVSYTEPHRGVTETLRVFFFVYL